MSMHLNCMVCRSIDEFIFCIGGNGDRAVRLARKLPAIDLFAGHGLLPMRSLSYSFFTLKPMLTIHRDRMAKTSIPSLSQL